jgi:hypothetical protein
MSTRAGRGSGVDVGGTEGVPVGVFAGGWKGVSVAGGVGDDVGAEYSVGTAGRHALRKRSARATRWIRARESLIQNSLLTKSVFILNY